MDKLEAGQSYRVQPQGQVTPPPAKKTKTAKASVEEPRRPLLPYGRNFDEDWDDVSSQEDFQEPEQEEEDWQEEHEEEEEQEPGDQVPDQARVNFPDPPIRPLEMDNIPEGWQALRNGMALGQEPGSIVFRD